MRRLTNHKIRYSWYVGALMCASLTACTSDGTIDEVETAEQVPMQFSQTALSTPAKTRGSDPLAQGFLVSCYKGIGSTDVQQVMDNYEVKYKVDTWNNLSCWNYVGTKTDGFYKDQVLRYWDVSAFPYQFYAVTPCPAPADIPQLVLTNSQFAMPASAEYVYQTCNNGVVSSGAEPYLLAQVECTDVSNTNDKDMLAGGKTIAKSASAYSRYVALPFHHLTSKVRFLIYNNYKKEIPNDFKLYNIKIKAASADYVIEGRAFTATLTSGNVFDGTFTDVTKGSDAEKVLVQTDDDAARKCDLKVAVDREHAYDCLNPTGKTTNDGLLQIPQKNVKLSFSFDVYGVEFNRNFESEDKHIKYDMATKTIHYNDVEIEGTYDLAPNTINTFVIKVNEFYPLTIDFSAELTPWTDVVGSIDTNLEN